MTMVQYQKSSEGKFYQKYSEDTLEETKETLENKSMNRSIRLLLNVELLNQNFKNI